jgi:Ti-type conjugative transfer relaxase TraA
LSHTGQREDGDILNVGKLRKGGELYYLNSVARGVEDYYTDSGEAPGYWLAGGSHHIGLSGEVSSEALRAVLAGRHPMTHERVIGKTRSRERVPGFDLTFRAPKSVSLLHALGDPATAKEVGAAHDAAVAAALDYMERHASGARRGKGGKTRISSRGFMGAAFRHRTSRAGDPLLHTHVLVANLIMGADGRWGAVDGRQLYVNAKTAGYLYQAHLRQELTRRLGLAWDPVHKGMADLAGVSRQVITGFSQRRSEIKEIVGEVREASAKAAQVAALTSRKAKDYGVSPAELLPEWKERAALLGLDIGSLGKLTGRAAYRAPAAEAHRTIELELASPEGLTSQASSFTRREVIQGFCDRLGMGARVESIERMADRFLTSDGVVPLVSRGEDPNPTAHLRTSEGRAIPIGAEERKYSTEEMLGVELGVIERSVSRRHDGCGTADGKALQAALEKRPSLFSDQQAMVKRLTTSGQGVEVVVGKAGAGKTFALDAAREAWETSGYRVIGCSLSARAAEELESGSGIRSCTIASLLRDLDRPVFGGFPGASVVVVDEAGMVGTRDLARLLSHAERSRAKVVLVGDDRQLPEIASGGAFRGIKNRLPFVELSEIRRQPLGWERDALDLIREGRSDDAIGAYLAHDRVVVTSSAEETRRRLLTDWWRAQEQGRPAIMLAARRSDVADLNARARALMTAAGRLGEGEVEFSGQSFSCGDRVMTLKNDRRLGVKNGTRGAVEQIDAAEGTIVMRCEDGRVLRLPTAYLEAGHLTHAYAMTGHKAQGMTTDSAYILGDQTLYREWTYVAMSRGRHENKLYVVAGVDHDREEVGGEVVSVSDPLSEVTSAVGRSRAKDLAVDVYERAAENRNLDPATWERVREL